MSDPSNKTETAAGNATVPTEAFDAEHPDHEWWVGQTGRCLGGCSEHRSSPGSTGDDQ